MADEVLTATEVARRLSEILNRVHYQGATFAVVRGRRRVARIVPAGAPRSVGIRDLQDLFKSLPRLEAGDAAALARDVAIAREEAGPAQERWD